MQAPLVFRAILGLLMDLTIPAALGAFVLAGMRLRSEGGMNFEASGGFLKWIFWGCFLLILPSVSSWLGSEGIPGASQLTQAGAAGAAYTAGIEKVTSDFVDNFLVGHVVPVVAASLVFKAVLDLSQGYSPLASIIAALFLLGVEGIWNLATGSWLQTGGQYGVRQYAVVISWDRKEVNRPVRVIRVQLCSQRFREICKVVKFLFRARIR
jgi:hypothetical protein